LTKQVATGIIPPFREDEMRVSGVLVGVAALGLAAFDAREAQNALHGEWQAVMNPIALSVDSASNTATMVNAGRSETGKLTVEALAGRAAKFTVGSKRYIAHFTTDRLDQMDVATEGASDAILFNRVK
jgi:hypothetical protein